MLDRGLEGLDGDCFSLVLLLLEGNHGVADVLKLLDDSGDGRNIEFSSDGDEGGDGVVVSQLALELFNDFEFLGFEENLALLLEDGCGELGDDLVEGSENAVVVFGSALVGGGLLSPGLTDFLLLGVEHFELELDVLEDLAELNDFGNSVLELLVSGGALPLEIAEDDAQPVDFETQSSSAMCILQIVVELILLHGVKEVSDQFDDLIKSGALAEFQIEEIFKLLVVSFDGLDFLKENRHSSF